MGSPAEEGGNVGFMIDKELGGGPRVLRGKKGHGEIYPRGVRWRGEKKMGVRT